MAPKKRRNFRHLTAFILLILAQGDRHGGAIYTKLCKDLPCFNTDSGAIYRVLQELESDGAVQATWDTSEPGAARKIYHMTDVGWEELRDWAEDIEGRVKNLNWFLEMYRQLKFD